MLNKIQQEKRKTGITGTDIGKICGITNPKWGTIVDVYEDKINPIVKEETPTLAQEIGSVLEEVGRRRFLADHPEVTNIVVPREHTRSSREPCLLALGDGIVTFKNGKRALLEIKTSSQYSQWGEEGSDDIPLSYLLQVNLYMSVYCLEATHLRLILLNNTERDYYIERNMEIVKEIRARAREFWYGNVLKRIQPEYNDAKRIVVIPESNIVADDDILNAVNEYRRLKELVDVDSLRLDALKDKISYFMGDKEHLLTEGNFILAKKSSYKTTRLDTKELANVIDLEPYRKQSLATRLTIK